MILRLFHISRPVLWINTVGPATVGMWLAGDLFAWGALPILLWLTLPFNLLIYGVNDVFDQETDAKNPRKGTLEGARIDRSEVRPLVLGVIFTNAPFLIYSVLFVPFSAKPGCYSTRCSSSVTPSRPRASRPVPTSTR